MVRLFTVEWVSPQERVNLAHQIEKIEFYNSKEKQHNSWFKQAAAALELELDEDLLIGEADITRHVLHQVSLYLKLFQYRQLSIPSYVRRQRKRRRRW